MLPSIRKQDTLDIISPTAHRYRPGNVNRSRSNSSHGLKYEHGTEMKKKIKTDFAYNEYIDNGKSTEGPIDLSASNTIKIEPEPEHIQTHENDLRNENEVDERRLVKFQKTKQKKRKIPLPTEENWNIETVSAERLPKQAVNKREEVLKAARSLFSKRTRTLYHWMYPDTSKGKLKSIVSSAWDTLSNTEKEFYISQVLGRFGVPAGSLMVNPQLGGFQNREVVSSSYAILASANNTSTSDIDANTCIQITPTSLNCDDENLVRPKKRRKESDEASSHLPNAAASLSTESYDDDEFADDPELTTELMQFQRAMGQSD